MNVNVKIKNPVYAIKIEETPLEVGIHHSDVVVNIESLPAIAVNVSQPVVKVNIGCCSGDGGGSGADGKTILNGSGAPDSGIGVNGDFYIDTDTWEIYGPKAAGAWGAGVSIVGPQGDQGPQGEQGPQGDPGAGASFTATAGEDLAARDLVYLDAAGDVYKADASDGDKEAVGFVQSDFATSVTATVFPSGIITGFTGLTPNLRYYLSTDTPGAITDAIPATGIVQQVCKALTATTAYFDPKISALII